MQSQTKRMGTSKQPKDAPIQDIKLPTVSYACALAIFIICTFLICALILLNVFIDSPLFIQGLNFIYDYQHRQPYGAFQVIQNLFSLLANPIGIGVILIIYYIVVNRKLLLIVHLSYFLFTTYIIALLKQALQQSRPIWYDSRIQNWQWFCPKDFGNPSGHSFAVIMLYEPIISDSINYGKFRPWGYILVLLCVMVPISRMYLGVHSANQTLFGLSLGCVFLILYKYIYQKALYELYWQFLLGSRRKIKIIGVVLLNLICIVIPIIFFVVNRKDRPMLLKDIENLNHRCETQLTGQEVQSKMLTACAIGCFAFGLLYGFILLSNTSGYRKYLLGLWAYESKPKVLLKILVYVVCAGIPFVVFWAIGTYAVKQPIAKYILLCIAATGAGLGLSYLAPMVSSKLHILKLLPGSAEDYENRLPEIHD